MIRETTSLQASPSRQAPELRGPAHHTTRWLQQDRKTTSFVTRLHHPRYCAQSVQHTILCRHRRNEPVRELRNRSCGDQLLVKASKIPRDSVMSIPPTCRTVSSKCQRRIEAPCISDQASRVSPLFEPAIFLGSFKDRHAIIVFLTIWSGTIAGIGPRSKN